MEKKIVKHNHVAVWRYEFSTPSHFSNVKKVCITDDMLLIHLSSRSVVRVPRVSVKTFEVYEEQRVTYIL